MSASNASMRFTVSEPVSPAPTMSERGSPLDDVPNSDQLLLPDHTRMAKRAAAVITRKSIHATTYTRNGKRAPNRK